jgi:hypothetical protein
MIRIQDIVNSHLHPMQHAQLVMAVNMAEAGAEVWVSLTAPKTGDSKPRVAGKDYVALPGISPQAQIGTLHVDRYVDNPSNRRIGRAGQIKLLVNSITRANGRDPKRPTGVRVMDITSFAILGFYTPETEMATEALGRAAQAPQGA